MKKEVQEEEGPKAEGEEQSLTVDCSKSVYCVSNVEALWACANPEDIPFEYKPKAKSAETRFVFVHYDEASDHSVVLCYPKTGRTH